MSPFDHDAEILYTALVGGVAKLRRNAIRAQTRLVGIASGGVWLAERLQADLAMPDAYGVISSAMHRDDFSTRGLSAAVQTKLPFDVNGAHIVLLDDVLFTGRTIRAVLNELFDYGRPASVQLAVLVDRGGRELPIEAAFCSVHAHVASEKKLTLARSELGVLNFAIEG